MVAFIVVFFFNDTATTEIYTYGHTLALHYALPICVRLAASRTVAKASGSRSSRLSPASCRPRSHGVRARSSSSDKAWTSGSSALICRSEEHTSELQSLMRISYAVFCLKKKKYTNSQHNKIHVLLLIYHKHHR